MALLFLGIVLWCLSVTTAGIIVPDRPECLPAVGNRCLKRDRSVDENFYTVNGVQHMVSFSEGKYYIAKCEAAALGDPALPAFARRMRFRRVTLTGCAPPPDGSYADAFAALNISVFDRLNLRGLPKDSHLTATSFVGLESLIGLELKVDLNDGVLELAAEVLKPLDKLQSLVLMGVRPSSLPPTLTALSLRFTGLTVLPPEALNVVTLEISEKNLTDMGGLAPRLEVLTLNAPLKSRPRAPLLREASITLWQEASPEPWSDCEHLELLSLIKAAATRLPAGFVAACGKLHTLEFQLMQAAEIPKGFLRGARALKTLKAAFWPLRELPPDLLDYSPDLKDLDLSNNGLDSLPNGVFTAVAESLRSLSLARNRLRAAAALALAPLTDLRVLNLSNNSLGDLCPAASKHILARSVSYLSAMKQLEQLILSRTDATRICADYTHHMHKLQRLDLTYNHITELQFADLKIQRDVLPADVDVSGNPLRRVRCDRADYDLAADDAIPKQTAKLVMNSRLDCSCDAYWLARALRERRVVATFEPLCDASDVDPPGKSILNKPLRSVPLTSLVCEIPPSVCAAGCRCVLEPALDGLAVTCAGVGDLGLANLTSVPIPVRRVTAAGVATLPDRLPDTLEMLDLSNGSIEWASAEQANALFAHNAKVRLAGNPLRCDCDNRALLAALEANQALVLDYESTTCADNRTVAAALGSLACARAAPWPLGALVALCAAALAVALVAALAAALASRPEARLRIKAFLHSRGVGARWLARRFEPADESREFDAFVAYAPQDTRFVAERLARELERAPRARRLCLDYRDWPVGAWIPAQIDASVRHSRCTLAVVSRHFGAGSWARAGLRAAHAAALREGAPRRRVLLVLLDVRARDLDAELRALVAAHRTLRWGEPGFWDELRYSLPQPPPAAA